MSERVPAIEERVSYVAAGRAERQAWLRAPRDLSAGNLRVLGAVFGFTTSYSKLTCYVSQVELAGFAKVSTRTVSRSLALLAETGVVVFVPGDGAGNLTLIGVPPYGEKGDAYLSTLGLSNLSTFEGAEGGQDRRVKVDTQRGRVTIGEARRTRANPSPKEERLGPSASRDQDPVVGEETPSGPDLLEETDRFLDALIAYDAERDTRRASP